MLFVLTLLFYALCFVCRMPPPSALEMLIPAHAVGKVMGKGGANLANIRKVGIVVLCHSILLLVVIRLLLLKWFLTLRHELLGDHWLVNWCLVLGRLAPPKFAILYIILESRALHVRYIF